MNAGHRASLIHCAHVYLAEARRRRNQPAFHAALLNWVASARRKAASCIDKQGSLFA